MAKNTDKTKVYIGTLDRFGYDLRVVSMIEEQCRTKLLEEYVRAYKIRNNGSSPCKDIAYDRGSEDKTYYDLAKEDIVISEYTFDKVEWE